MSDNQISLASSATTLDIKLESLKEAMTLDKIEAWAKRYYASGASIPHCTYPLSENCIVALYLNDIFKAVLPKDFYITQGRFRTKIIYETHASTAMEVVTPMEMKYLINLYDDNISNISKAGRIGNYELDEVLALIQRARVAYDADYNPVHLKAMCDADKG